MSKTTTPGIISLSIAACICSISHAAVLHVPADYAAIQSAINNSTNGDVVLVSQGVYNENINFKGKTITVTSTNVSDPNVVGNTVIHAVGKSSAVTFASGETSNAVLAGFTITGGYGTLNVSFGTNLFFGAGIYCITSSPTILGNVITSNAAPDGSISDAGYGCGIACVQCDAIVNGNVIKANSGYGGGGILTYLGNANIANNLIYSNSAAVGGGALMISGSQLINNTLVGNASGGGGNIYVTSDSSGQCFVTDNIIANATNGGGIYIDPSDVISQVTFNDVWNNAGGDYYATPSRTGLNGNISQDPLFVDSANNDYHLQDVSPCINAGDTNFQPSAGELDFYGAPRVYAKRVDIGAAEYFDNFRPLADAGPDQMLTVTNLPVIIALDGSSSSDPNGASLIWHWTQLSGPTVSLANSNAAQPSFTASTLGTYSFQLIVNNGSFDSFSDTVQVTVKNDPPIADAGDNQFYSDQTPIASITLDGSRSSDPENVTLTYHWTELSGWNVQLSDPTAVKPTFQNPFPGTYIFQLIVNDGIQDSQPSMVKITIGPNHAPIADPGPAPFLVSGSVMLDGTKSYDPDGSTLTYQWKQVSGPTVTIIGTNTATPTVTVPTEFVVTKCVFQLVVSDGSLLSSPTNVTVTIVPNYGTNALYLDNPPFDTNKPTLVVFGGGNCSTGDGMTFGGIWEQQANWITVNTYASSYDQYGDMLVTYLFRVAPNYKKPIQTIGFSTGNMPAMEVARHVNSIYVDARYAVNRVTLLDAVCSNLGTSVSIFDAKPIGGEQCWVDNYISNDPGHTRQGILPGALNVVCNPPRAHEYPVDRYATNSLDFANGGLCAFGYLSLIGGGKNYQLNTTSQKYYFNIDTNEAIVFTNQSLYPGKIMAPVQLTGPSDGDTITTNGSVFTCGTVQNATHYQLLFGSDPDHIASYTAISYTTNPPTQTITNLPYDKTWWTIKAYDQFGSTIYADPRLINRPANNPPVANAGPAQIVRAGLDGTATVALDGSNSSDADADPLTFTWAWLAGANTYLTNGINPTIALPPGTYTIQLLVNDGRTNSQPTQVNITVLPPLPVLSIILSDTNAILTWSTNNPTFQLESTATLDSATIWSNVPTPPTISNDQFLVTDPIEPQKLYRLRSP